MSAHQHLGDAWGAENSPSGITGAYANEIDAIAPGAAQAAAESKGPYETGIDALFRVANQLITTDAQRRALQIQLEQARRGQPPAPMATSPYGSSFATMSPALKWGGLALLGLGAFYMLKRRRR